MALNIYTAGSGEFLEIILNASAMITGSGFSEDLARVGLIIGMLLLGFQAIWNGQGISFHKAGLLFVLYLLFYGPTTTAVIEDTTTNQVRIVDNLPLGPTFVGSVISTVAYKITEVAEQGFSTPAMTEYGLFSSLNTIARVRDVLRNPMALDSFANYRKADGWDLPKSVTEYLTYCTLNPINLRNNTSIDELYRASGVEAIFNAPLLSQSAYIYDGGYGGRLETCTVIRPILNAAIQDAMIDVMSDILDKGFAPEKAAGKVVTAPDLENQIDQSIQSFAISGKNAQEYTQMSLIQPIFGDARVNALNHWQEQNAALALRESLNQQELQWAGKGDTFKHYMRPMIAFFEGLLYAMTPFMAFAMVLGDKGLSILGKYLVLPLAIALWMPLLTIVNAFTLWYASAEMQAIFDGYDAMSDSFAMLQLMDMDHAISKALGVGGLLAASVPPLALFIVSGSAMVANSIMSQMTQGDKFKSEDMMPRSKEQAPVMATTASATSDQIAQGVFQTGRLQTAETITGEQSATALVKSSRGASEEATAQYQKVLQAGATELSGSASGRESLAGIGENIKASLDLSNNSSANSSIETMRSLGIGESSINQAIANASLGLQTPLGGMKRSDNTSTDSMTKEDRAKAEKAIAQLSESIQATGTDDRVFAAGDAFKNSHSAQRQLSNVDTISETGARAIKASRAYEYANSNQDVIAAGQSLNLRDSAVKSLDKGPTRMGAALGMEELAGRTESGRELYKKAYASEDIRRMSGDDSERRAMAATRALNQDGRLGELLMSEHSPLDFNVNQGNARENESLVASARDATAGTETLSDEFDSKRAFNSEAWGSTNDMNRSGYQDLKENGERAVQERRNENAGKVLAHHQEAAGDVNARHNAELFDHFRGVGSTSGNAHFSRGVSSIDSAFSGVYRTLVGDSKKEFDAAYERGLDIGLTETQAKGYAYSERGFALGPEAKQEIYNEAYERSGGDDLYSRGVAETIWNAGSEGKQLNSNADLKLVADSFNGLHNPVTKDPVRPPLSLNEDVPETPLSYR